MGASAFIDSLHDIQGAIAKAKELRATLILYELANPEQVTSTSAIAVPSTQTTIFSGRAFGSGYSGTATSYGSTVIPITSSSTSYDQTAYYFAKLKHPVPLGIAFTELPTYLRKR